MSVFALSVGCVSQISGAAKREKPQSSTWKDSSFGVLEPQPIHPFDALRDGTSFPERLW
jgi:hypothetical protein